MECSHSDTSNNPATITVPNAKRPFLASSVPDYLYLESGRKVYKDGISHLRLYNIDFGKDVTNLHYLKVTLSGVQFEEYEVPPRAIGMVFRYFSKELKMWINLKATDETAGVYKLELPADYPLLHSASEINDILDI